MARTSRRASQSDIYHVIIRGVGKQLIFEDDTDHLRFLDMLDHALKAGGEGMALYAWVLMDNHVHMLLRSPLEQLSSMMRRLGCSYALYFNRRHNRCGHLFQDRFWSEPVETEAYFLTVLRYIHMNPVRGGLSTSPDYRWSSFEEYLGDPVRIDPELAIGLLGSTDAFTSFHGEEGDAKETVSQTPRRPRCVGDERALELALGLFGDEGLHNLKALPKSERDAAILDLRRKGISVRQVQRLTGVSLGAISNACRNG